MEQASNAAYRARCMHLQRCARRETSETGGKRRRGEISHAHRTRTLRPHLLHGVAQSLPHSKYLQMAKATGYGEHEHVATRQVGHQAWRTNVGKSNNGEQK